MGRRIGVSSAARRLGVTVWTVYAMIRRGELVSAKRRSRKPGSWYTLDHDEVEEVARERECSTRIETVRGL